MPPATAKTVRPLRPKSVVTIHLDSVDGTEAAMSVDLGVTISDCYACLLDISYEASAADAQAFLIFTNDTPNFTDHTFANVINNVITDPIIGVDLGKAAASTQGQAPINPYEMEEPEAGPVSFQHVVFVSDVAGMLDDTNGFIRLLCEGQTVRKTHRMFIPLEEE